MKPLNLSHVIMNTGFTNAISDSSLSSRFSSIFKNHLNKNFTINLNRKRHISENKDFQEYNHLKQKLEKVAHESGNSLPISSTIYYKQNVK